MNFPRLDINMKAANYNKQIITNNRKLLQLPTSGMAK